MASTDLSLTGQTPTNNKIFTFSAWVKRSAIGGTTANTIMSWEKTTDSSYTFSIRFRTDDILQILDYANGVVMDYRTTQVFRDTSAWYAITVAVDTTNATANDRTKVWVNGERVTSFGTQTTYSLNASTQGQQSGYDCAIGSVNAAGYFNGSMTHVHFIDGTAYDASDFGQTDATTGIWSPKTAPSVTYGTNGFFLKMENSGSMGTDSSGNGNNFTVSGNLTQTVDTPSNVFATWNANHRSLSQLTLSRGNTTVTGTTTAYQGVISTLGVSSGKWYWEYKIGTTINGSTTELVVGAALESALQAWNGNDGQITSDGITTYGSSWSAGDIASFELDFDANTFKIIKNNSTEILSKTSLPSETVFPYVAVYGSGVTIDANFGNGYFGTTAVASANADDNGIGAFEYAPPTGYLALCTKNINAQEYS